MRCLSSLCVAVTLGQPAAAGVWCRKPVEENYAPVGMVVVLENGTLTVSGERCSPPTDTVDYHCPGLAKSLWPDWPRDV